MLLAALTVASLAVPAAAAPRPPHAYPAAIEPLAPYAAQRICSPTVKPGTYALSRMLLTAYPGTRSLGIVRACGVGGTSEHKEGRAFDWGEVFQAQSEFVRESLERATEFNRRYLEVVQSVMRATASATEDRARKAA